MSSPAHVRDRASTTRHTEDQIREAIGLVPMPDARTAQAWERQLRADDPGAWFIVSARKRRQLEYSLDCANAVEHARLLAERAARCEV